MEESQGKFFYGWVIVFAGLALSLIMYGVVDAFGIMFKPLSQEFQWDRATVSASSMINWLSFGVGNLVLGTLTDRIGSRRVMILGGMLFALGTLLMSQLQSVWHLYFVFGVLIAVGRSAAAVPLTALVTKWFTKNQGLALALAQSQNVGSAVFAPLSVFLLAQYGWRGAYIGLGLIGLLIIPLALLMRDHHTSRSQVSEAAGRAGAVSSSTLPGMTLGEAMRTRAFWTLNLMVIGCCSCHSCILLHGVNHMTDVGLTATTASHVVAVMAIFGMLGKIANGLMADKVGAKWSMAGFLFLQAITIPMFVHAHELPTFYMWAVLFGTGFGGPMPVYAMLFRQYFGTRHIGSILGFFFLTAAIGMGSGGMMGGVLYNMFGDYAIPFFTSTGTGLMAAILALTLPSTEKQKATLARRWRSPARQQHSSARFQDSSWIRRSLTIQALILVPSPPRLFYGWIVTACAFCVLFLTYGVQYSFGVFLPAMLDELGWQRASIAGAFSLYSMMYSGCSLISGRLTDSRGPQFVIALGGVLLGLGIIATSRMSATWHLYVFYGLVASLGMSTAYIPCNTTVVKWFQRQRGLALGLASSGSSCGILICPPLASHFIAQWGWRPVYCACGVMILLVLNVVARFMVRSPELLGLAPDGDALSPQGHASASSSRHSHEAPQPVVVASHAGWTLQQAWRLPTFWLLFIVFVIMLLTVPVPFVHIVSYARDLGFSPTQGAWAVSMMGLCAFVGSLSLGPLSDRIGRKRGLLLSLILQVVAFVLFLSATSLGQLYCGAAVFGFFYGGMATLFPALIGDFFGRLHAGTLTGFLFAGAGILGAWGPMLAGYLRDTSGSYHVAFRYGIATSVVALLLFVFTPKPPSLSSSPPRG